MYYKVVRCKNKKLYSSVAGSDYGTMKYYRRFKRVRYIKNTWVASKDPNNPKLWVTDNPTHALQILLWDIERYASSKGAIYECEVFNALPHDRINNSSSYLVDAVKIVKRIK